MAVAVSLIISCARTRRKRYKEMKFQVVEGLRVVFVVRYVVEESWCGVWRSGAR